MSDHLLQGSVQGSLTGLLIDYCAQHGLQAPLGCHPIVAGERLPFATWQQYMHAVAAQDCRPALGLAIARLVQPRHVGLLGYLGLSCATLYDALQQLLRYNRLAYDGSAMLVEMNDQRLTLSWGREAGCPGQLVDETAIGLLYQLISQLVAPQPLPLSSVSFINAPPPDVQPYRVFFGCPVSFDAVRTTVCLEMKWLSLPLGQPDTALQHILDQQAAALLAALPQANDFERCLQAALVEAIHNGQVRIGPVAERLSLSVRALQRRLAQLGTGYQHRLDQVRCTLAQQYLSDPQLGLADIALLLGYSEQSAFQRAFREWMGCTPNQWRQHLRLTAGFAAPTPAAE
jgi:AraC-like DNA-binding protein